MEEQLISKKELLELTGISYGQLYRWKRKDLVPEDWFIRKSTFTGQETFFPKDKILTRIAKIKNMKEDLSLDDLADIFSPNLAGVTLSDKAILEQNIVSKAGLDFFIEHNAGRHLDNDGTVVFDFEDILFAYVLDKMLQAGEISLDEGKTLLRGLLENYEKFDGKSCELIFIRKLGVGVCLLISQPSDVYFETGAKVIARQSLATCIEELKIKIG